MADDEVTEAQQAELDAQAQAAAAASVEQAAQKGYVRGGPDGPQDIEGVLRRRSVRPEQTWTRGDDPAAAALSLAEASVGTTGGPFAGSYNHAAQALAEPVSDEDRIAAQHRQYAESSAGVPEEEAQAQAAQEAAEKQAAADAATGKSQSEPPAEAPPAPPAAEAPPADAGAAPPAAD